MDLTITNELVREAALINLLDIVDSVDEQERIRTELWCLRNGIDTANLHDITMHSFSTSELIRQVLESTTYSQHEHAARLLCTMSEIS